ncbi:DEAD/DEAH box helicase family protein [candidate division KSB1 bacterium]|nr:DEAD/DEAH box helicase family protein [candidate division KSB1 bacterium]
MSKVLPEKVRQSVKEQLLETGWEIQDAENIDLAVPNGIAVNNFPLLNRSVDYLLFIDRMAVGIVLIDHFDKLNGVEKRILEYLNDVPNYVPHIYIPLPLFYVYNGKDLLFLNIRDVIPSWRKVFSFYHPGTIKQLLSLEKTQNAKIYSLPPLDKTGLWDCQFEFVQLAEKALLKSQPRFCARIAIGAGKTKAAFVLIQRLLQYTHAQRFLYITDRDHLGRQVLNSYQSFLSTEDSNIPLTDRIQFLSRGINSNARIFLTTLQELGGIFQYPDQYDSEETLFGKSFKTLKADPHYPDEYPIETFDYIIIDDCAPSALKYFHAIFDYFDAPVIGLTSTCSKQVYEFYQKNILMEYKPERAIADGCIVDYAVYSFKISGEKRGISVDGYFQPDKRTAKTKRIRWATIDRYSEMITRELTSKTEIRAVALAFKERLFTEIFPGRSFVPKTIVFARNDKQADFIVQAFQKIFSASSDFCVRISSKDVDNFEKLISQFNDSINPRLLVTTDFACGTNFRAVECLFFFCQPGSAVAMQMMKGRGARTISSAELQFVSPDATIKTRFLVFDTVGICSKDQSDFYSLERKKNDSLEDLFNHVNSEHVNVDVITTLAGRLAQLNLKISQDDRILIEKTAFGKPLKQIIHSLLDVTDPDVLEEIAKELFNSVHPNAQQVQSTKKELIKVACSPLRIEGIRKVILELYNKYESSNSALFELEDNESLELINEKAKSILGRFKKFLQDHKNSLKVLQGIYFNNPEWISYENIKQAAEVMSKHPYCLQIETVWLAYQHYKKNIQQGSGKRAMTDFISLVHYERGSIKFLKPFAQLVEDRYKTWLRINNQEKIEFLPVQIDFLELLKNYFGKYAYISLEDLDLAPLHQTGGSMKMYQLFGNRMEDVLCHFNRFLMAVPK